MKKNRGLRKIELFDIIFLMIINKTLRRYFIENWEYTCFYKHYNYNYLSFEFNKFMKNLGNKKRDIHSQTIYFFAINNIDTGLSGGDTIWINLAKQWAKDKEITIIGCNEALKTLEGNYGHNKRAT